ncbi:MAG: hypothetical protein ACOZIN_03370 [Myxococcota bacterium]
MTRTLSTALFLLAAVAHGQAEEEAPPSPPPVDNEKPGPAQSPAEAPPAPPNPLESLPPDIRRHLKPPSPVSQAEQAEAVALLARLYFERLLQADAHALVELSHFPFHLEDRAVSSPDELLQEWLKHLRSRRTDLLTLYGVEVLTPQEMEKKYGKPPSRLSALPWRGANTFLAVANISSHAAIAVVKNVGGGQWKVIAFHD